MLRNCIVIATLAVCASGCATTHQLDLSRPSETWVAEIRQSLLNEDVSIILLNGRMTEGVVTRLTADSLWLRPEEGREGSLRR